MAIAALRLPSRTKARRTPVKSKHYRTDIQGLRAIAVGTVLLYHAGMPWMPGGYVGVDVFFVISGFLITGGIVRELRKDGRLSLKNFYIRRMARILPAATLVLVLTVMAAWLLLPETRWREVGMDAVASGLYFVNWLFAESSIDYLAQDQAPSPLQHFWSLAVEEQFYIVWPVLLMLVGWLSLKLNFRLQKGLLVALGIVGLPSFLWSVYYTAENPGGAYFVTTTRMWELAIGAGLAIIVSRAPGPPKFAAALVSWVGLGAIIGAAVIYTEATPFPSYAALLPTLGAAAVIWGGHSGGNMGAGLVLNRWPMVQLGEISYSLYLWHWPLLIITAGVIGELSPLAGLTVIVGALIPAWLSTRYVEVPAQYAVLNFKKSSSDNEKLTFGSLFTLVGLVPAVLLAVAVPPPPPAATVEFVPAQIGNEKAPILGAAALALDPALGQPADTYATYSPSAADAINDLPISTLSGCNQGFDESAAEACIYGDPDSEFLVALVGDSHAEHWVPAFKNLSEKNGWRLETYTKSACALAEGVPYNYTQKMIYESCADWNDAVMAQLQARKPDVVLTSSLVYHMMVDGSPANERNRVTAFASAVNAQWRVLNDSGVQVITIADTPDMGIVVPDCVAQNEATLTACSTPRDQALAYSGVFEDLASQGLPAVTKLDMNDMICPAADCSPIIGNVLVYRDKGHLTATYSRTLSGPLEAKLLETAAFATAPIASDKAPEK